MDPRPDDGAPASAAVARELEPGHDDGKRDASLDTLAILLRQVLFGLSREVDQRLASRALTLAKLIPLMALRDGQHHTATSIARYSHSDAGAMTRTISSLEEIGLIARHRSRDDRRVVYLELTSAGSDVTRSVPPILDEVLEARLGGLSESERATLLNLLRRVGANAEAGAA